MTKSLIIVPTYNEVENILAICQAIYKNLPNTHILIVDDNSTDGTKDLITKLERDFTGSLFSLSRAGKLGLGTAYLTGFRWALDKNYEIIVQMDADFSHPPARLPALLDALAQADVAIGSRYVNGGSVENWGFARRMISRFGSFYARTILGMSIRDLTGGFNAWRRTTLLKIPLDKVRSEGYSFQIELKYRAIRAGLKLIEVPISFTERRAGNSKMSSGIIFEAIYRVIQIRFRD